MSKRTPRIAAADLAVPDFGRGQPGSQARPKRAKSNGSGGASKRLQKDAAAAQSKSARTRRQLLDAAARQIREHGYAQTRLSDIVASIGIHPASIYYHFPSKDAVVMEVVKVAMLRGFGFIKDSVEALPPEAQPLDRVATAIYAQMRIIMELSDYVAAALRIMGEESPGIYRSLLGYQRTFARYWDTLLEDAQRERQLRGDVNVPLLRALLIGAMGWRIEYYTNGKLTWEQVADEVVKTFLVGMVNESLREQHKGPISPPICKHAVESVARRFSIFDEE